MDEPGIVLAVMVCAAIMVVVVVPAVAQSPTPFVIYGEVLKADGSPCDEPVQITNLNNTGDTWSVSPESGYFILVLTSDDVNTGDIIRIETQGCMPSVTEYVVTQDEIDNGALDTYGYLRSSSVLPTTFITNTRSSITATISNDGPPVSAFEATLEIDGTSAGTKRVEGLDSGELTTLGFNYTPTVPGTFNMTLIVDPEHITDSENGNRTIHQFSIPVTVIGLPGGRWEKDDEITAGLASDIRYSTPTVFQMNGTWYLISGDADGTFHGYRWTGSAWQQDEAIVAGLSDVGNYSSPAVFQMNGTWYLIAGRAEGFSGFRWMDAAAVWEPYDEIVDGLKADYKPHATNYLNHPVVIQKDGIWYVISGNMPKWTGVSWDRYIKFYGHRWNGSAWVEDDGIVSGLPRRITHLAPSVFCGNGEWYLISGNSTGRFMGYKWVRSWQPDDALTTGLDDVGNRSTPVVFSIDGT